MIPTTGQTTVAQIPVRGERGERDWKGAARMSHSEQDCSFSPLVLKGVQEHGSRGGFVTHLPYITVC